MVHRHSSALAEKEVFCDKYKIVPKVLMISGKCNNFIVYIKLKVNRKMMITPKQCKAARALLDWKQSDLAKITHVSVSTVKNFEAGYKKSNYITIQALQMTLEKVGIEFLGNSGVKLKKS